MSGGFLCTPFSSLHPGFFVMRELPYFKFFPGEWIKGDITICSHKAQGLFINICCYYWMKGCNMSLTSVQQRFNECSTEIKELVKEEIISVDNDKISINFLEDQFSEFELSTKQKSRAGKASAKARESNTRSTPVKQPMNEEEKIREDKKRKEKIPSVEDFKDYAIENKPKVDIDAVELKYKAWIEAGWIDGNDKPIKNWKSKLLNTLPHLKEKVSTGMPKWMDHKITPNG